MPKAKDILILASAGGMELCWLFALVFFFLSLLERGFFPVAGGFAAFWLAALLGFVVRGRGWRIIQVLGVQLAGMAAVFLPVLYTGREWSFPFLSAGWLEEVGASFQNFSEGASLVLMTVAVMFFWYSGARFSGRSPAYSTITARFDLGVAVFFFLFVFTGALGQQVPAAQLLLFPFFLFSMLAIALARSRGTGKKDYLLGFGKIGLVFLVCLALLLFSLGIVFLFLPGMTTLAESGYVYGKQLSAPLFNVLHKILLFMFARRSLRPEPAGSAEGGAESSVPGLYEASGTLLWERILTVGMSAVFGILLLVMAVVGLVYLYRWLFSRTSRRGQKDSCGNVMLFWLALLWAGLRRMLLQAGKLFSPSVKPGDGKRYYRKLLRWGRSCGFPRRPAETPGEYGVRLGKYFPLLREGISSIIESYHDEMYGELALKSPQKIRLRKAWHQITAPRHWYSRLKTRLTAR